MKPKIPRQWIKIENIIDLENLDTRYINYSDLRTLNIDVKDSENFYVKMILSGYPFPENGGNKSLTSIFGTNKLPPFDTNPLYSINYFSHYMYDDIIAIKNTLSPLIDIFNTENNRIVYSFDYDISKDNNYFALWEKNRDNKKNICFSYLSGNYVNLPMSKSKNIIPSEYVVSSTLTDFYNSLKPASPINSLQFKDEVTNKFAGSDYLKFENNILKIINSSYTSYFSGNKFITTKLRLDFGQNHENKHVLQFKKYSFNNNKDFYTLEVDKNEFTKNSKMIIRAPWPPIQQTDQDSIITLQFNGEKFEWVEILPPPPDLYGNGYDFILQDIVGIPGVVDNIEQIQWAEKGADFYAYDIEANPSWISPGSQSNKGMKGKIGANTLATKYLSGKFLNDLVEIRRVIYKSKASQNKVGLNRIYFYLTGTLQLDILLTPNENSFVPNDKIKNAIYYDIVPSSSAPISADSFFIEIYTKIWNTTINNYTLDKYYVDIISIYFRNDYLFKDP